MAKRIVTEADLLKMPSHGELVIDDHTVVTPAALDTAYTRGIRVIFRKTRSPFPKPVQGREKLDCLESIPALPDGDYVVQVRKGRVRVYRINEDGIQPSSDNG